MKKCLIISFVLALSCKAQACGPEIHTHNQYLFSVEEPYDGSSAVDGKRFDAFWKQYTKGKVALTTTGPMARRPLKSSCRQPNNARIGRWLRT